MSYKDRNLVFYLFDHCVKVVTFVNDSLIWMIWMYLITDVCQSKWGCPIAIYINVSFNLKHFYLQCIWDKRKGGGKQQQLAAISIRHTAGARVALLKGCWHTSELSISALAWYYPTKDGWVAETTDGRKKMNLERSTADEHIYIRNIGTHVYPSFWKLVYLQAHR